MEPSDDVTDDDIPQSVWNIIPKSSAYMKNILKFSGYTTRESFALINGLDDLQKVFDFVKENSELIDPESLGIFAHNPEKLKILPGVEGIVRRFLNKIKSLKRRTQLLKNFLISRSVEITLQGIKRKRTG